MNVLLQITYVLFFRFYLGLIISYELFNNGDYEKSLSEIQKIVKYVEMCKFDKSNNHYLETCNHIARTSNAYIALTLNVNFEKVNLNYYYIYN